MKYCELLQLADFFSKYKELKAIKRIANNELLLSLDGDDFIFNLDKSNSGIYQANKLAKAYFAPFDIALSKNIFKCKIKKVSVLEQNRVLVFTLLVKKSYKSFINKLYFEFTGKHTNVILVDENEIIIQALRLLNKSYRVIKVGQALSPLKPFDIKEKPSKINDFKEYFKEQNERINLAKLANLRQIKLASLEKKISNLYNKYELLESEDELLRQATKLSKQADVLAANLNNIKEYERSFILKDFENKTMVFKLENPPKQALNTIYKQARRKRTKALNINIEKSNLSNKLEALKDLKEIVLTCKDFNFLQALFSKKSLREKKQSSYAVLDFYFDNFKISLGQNERANEYLLKIAKKDDIWLHLKDRVSPHVIIKNNKQKIYQEVIEFAARICVGFSKLQNGSYLVDYTARKNVKVREKAFVNYVSFKSISIKKE